MKERLARDLAQCIISENKTEDRMIFPIGGSEEMIVVTVVRTCHDPRTVNTQLLRLDGKVCPACGGKGHG